MTTRVWQGLAGGVVLLATAVLLAMRRPAICPCGTIALWHGAVQSAENSQQIADWYSLSHVVHGLIFYALLRLAAPRAGVWPRFAAAVAAEAAWEVLENTPMVMTVTAQ